MKDHPDKFLMVANTHLCCGQKLSHLRAVQMSIIVQHLEKLLCTQYNGKDIAVIICGDFNANPYSAVVDLLTNGRIDAKHADWFTGMVQFFQV
jgi:endonuclease/exonuclease/phosphatase family metal-dependent hydrolase